MSSSIKKKSKSENISVKNGAKYLAIALPLMFLAPVIITIGFKAIAKSNAYFLLIIGCVLAVITIALVTQGIRIILKAMFNS